MNQSGTSCDECRCAAAGPGRWMGHDMKRLGLRYCSFSRPPLAATAQTIERIKILDFGIYTRDIISADKEANVATGRINISQNFKLVQKTDTVVMKKGVTFGVRYETVGKPKGQQVKLTWVMRFPEPGLVDPKGQRFYTNEFARDHIIGNESFRAYSLDETWRWCPANGCSSSGTARARSASRTSRW